MKNILTTSLFALSLTACATPAQITKSQLNEGLEEFVGQPVDVAFARLGQPHGQIEMEDEVVYGWRTEEIQRYVSTTTGISSGDARLSPFLGRVNATTRGTAEQACEIRIVAGSDGVISGWQYIGHSGTCADYAAQMG